MARPKLDEVVSNWYALHEGFQTSVQEFYAALEEALERREIPGIKKTRVFWQQGGLLTAEREYLRVQRERLRFDICAAPFGTGFFFSWWLVERQPLRALVAAPILLVLMSLAYYGLSVGMNRAIWAIVNEGGLRGIYLAYVLSPTVLLIVKTLLSVFGMLLITRFLATQYSVLFLEDGALAIPIVGWIYRRWLRPITYFWMDEAIMFQTAVHRAVMEVIQTFTTAQGIRALTPGESKPVFQRFIR